jgi:hypothetical protein
VDVDGYLVRSGTALTWRVIKIFRDLYIITLGDFADIPKDLYDDSRCGVRSQCS